MPGQCSRSVPRTVLFCPFHGVTPSRPPQWVATPRFLTQVGLGSLRDLPTSHLTRSKPFGRPSAANSNVSPADQKDPAGILQPLLAGEARSLRAILSSATFSSGLTSAAPFVRVAQGTPRRAG
jgi:hypothetical protein